MAKAFFIHFIQRIFLDKFFGLLSKKIGVEKLNKIINLYKNYYSAEKTLWIISFKNAYKNMQEIPDQAHHAHIGYTRKTEDRGINAKPGKKKWWEEWIFLNFWFTCSYFN